MPLTNDDLQSFHQFALAEIRDDSINATLEELVSKWRASKERRETNESILQSLAEIDAGEGKPAEQFLSEMESKHNLTMES